MPTYKFTHIHKLKHHSYVLSILNKHWWKMAKRKSLIQNAVNIKSFLLTSYSFVNFLSTLKKKKLTVKI